MLTPTNIIITAQNTKTGRIIYVIHPDVRIPVKSKDDSYYTEKYVLYKKSLDETQIYGMRYYTYSNNYKEISKEEVNEN